MFESVWVAEVDACQARSLKAKYLRAEDGTLVTAQQTKIVFSTVSSGDMGQDSGSRSSTYDTVLELGVIYDITLRFLDPYSFTWAGFLTYAIPPPRTICDTNEFSTYKNTQDQ